MEVFYTGRHTYCGLLRSGSHIEWFGISLVLLWVCCCYRLIWWSEISPVRALETILQNLPWKSCWLSPKAARKFNTWRVDPMVMLKCGRALSLLAALYTNLVSSSDSSSSFRWCTLLFDLRLSCCGLCLAAFLGVRAATAHKLALNGRQWENDSTSFTCCSGGCTQDSSVG